MTVFPIQALGKLIYVSGNGGTLAMLLAAAAIPGVSVDAQVQRSSLDLLDSLPIAVIVRNPAESPVTLRFRQPTEYDIEFLSGDGVVWSSRPPSPPPGVTFPEHTHAFGPGATTLAVYDWNELAADGSSPVAGKYDLRVRLLDEKGTSPVTLHVFFAAPLSPSTIATLKTGVEFTIAGALNETRDALSDERGSARLAKRLLGATPGKTYVVRGYVITRPDGSRAFTVERWAPYGESAPSGVH